MASRVTSVDIVKFGMVEKMCTLTKQIRAGTGGDEAGIWAGDLARMYMRFAEDRGWRTSVISESVADAGGFKECVMEVKGEKVNPVKLCVSECVA